MEIYERLKKYRIARGLKQIDVANAMQISKSTYSSYESGRRLPDATKIGKLAEILGVTSDVLLGTEHLTDNIYEQLEHCLITTSSPLKRTVSGNRKKKKKTPHEQGVSG